MCKNGIRIVWVEFESFGVRTNRLMSRLTICVL
jgi:hypothetical protein